MQLVALGKERRHELLWEGTARGSQISKRRLQSRGVVAADLVRHLDLIANANSERRWVRTIPGQGTPGNLLALGPPLALLRATRARLAFTVVAMVALMVSLRSTLTP